MEEEEQGEAHVRTHYVWIKSLGRLLSSQIRRKHTVYICDRCLLHFESPARLATHEEDCRSSTPVRLLMPAPPRDKLKFENIHKQSKCPFVVYADFESILLPIASTQPDPHAPWTQAYQRHEPYAIGLYVACDFDPSRSRFLSYCGETPAAWFLQQCDALAAEYATLLKHPHALHMRDEDERCFLSAVTCHICAKPLGNDRVRDHCHLSGRFRGAAHQQCNVLYRLPKRLPIVIHNGAAYDWHFIVHALATHHSKKIQIIAQNAERFITFMYRTQGVEVRFLDSYKFLAGSLDTLSANVPDDDMHCVRHYFPDPVEFALCRRKGVFPYDYIDSVDRLDETELPAHELFANTLTHSNVSREDYEHARRVWQVFRCRNIREYAMHYLKVDVLLLADIGEKFRHTSLHDYGLDPFHYFTIPGFSFDAMLKHTQQTLQLLTDPDMLLFFERGIRGGLVQLNRRHARANHPGLGEDYQPEREHSYLVLYDKNNLYGHSMMQPLPVGEFRWLTDTERTVFDIHAAAAAATTQGYVLEVDLAYPPHIHDALADLPFCPVTMCPPGSKQMKLLTTLLPKTRYVIHIRNLVQAMQYGVVLERVHRILTFAQRPWLAEYMALNTRLRQAASSRFERDLYKLMNVSIYGKSLENVRQYRRFVLTKGWTGRTGARKWIAHPAFVNSTPIGMHLMILELQKTTVTMNKPVYLGFTILEHSKETMYRFHYGFARQHFNTLALCYTDTDSFLYCTSSNVYDVMREQSDYFDTSNFPADNVHGIRPGNKLTPGVMKDETCLDYIVEYVGLRPKMYTFRTVSQRDKNKAKGVQRCVVRAYTLEDYKRFITDETAPPRSAVQHTLRSRGHVVYSEAQHKRTLCCVDDKRHWCDPLTSLPYGHYLLEQRQQDRVASSPAPSTSAP